MLRLLHRAILTPLSFSDRQALKINICATRPLPINAMHDATAFTNLQPPELKTTLRYLLKPSLSGA
jgi:hypothetical protein